MNTRIKELTLEIDELKAWKESAIQVSSELDTHNIARMLGGNVGESCNQVITRQVPIVLRRLAEAEDRINKLTDALKEAERYLVERGIETRGVVGRTRVLPMIRKALYQLQLQPCKGTNCGCTDGWSHSEECKKELDDASRES